MSRPTRSRLVTAAAVLLVVTIILARTPPLTLIGTDGACYARIAADLAGRPLATWADVQWMDGAFYEHPPLGLWLEGLWFKLLGSTAAAGVWLARWYSGLLAGVVWVTARRLVGPLGGAFALVGLATLASFQHESQNPMLELPLAVACALALSCCERLPTARRWVVGFALAATAAVWIKGIVAGALGVGLLWAWWRGGSLRRPVLALWLTALFLGLSIGAFEALRSAQGLQPYFETYLRRQVLVAFLQGRYSTEPDPFFHLTTLVTWHLSAVLAVPLLGWRWRAQSVAWKQLTVLGLGWMVAVVIPFSLAKQKSDWHLNLIIPGAAWVVGAALAALPARLLRFAPLVLFAATAGWCGLELWQGTHQGGERMAAIRAVTTTPAALHGAQVSNCSVLAPWIAQHLFAFHWQGASVDCQAQAPWSFDGVSLQPR